MSNWISNSAKFGKNLTDLATLGQGDKHQDPIYRGLRHAEHSYANPALPVPPGAPNPNDAANAARRQTDELRQRRGLVSNLYGGLSGQQPVTGKTQLGA